MKKNDIISFRVGIPERTQRGRVNWVDNGNVGITLIGDGFSGVEATVMPEEDCTVVIEYKGDALKNGIHSLSTEELKANIQRLKGMRFPRKVKSRGKSSASPSKRQRLTKLLEVLDGDPDALDALINKALKEEKR